MLTLLADPIFISLYAAHATPIDIMNILHAAYGLPPLVLTSQPQLIRGSIGDTWSSLQERMKTLRYLLLLGGNNHIASGIPQAHIRSSQSYAQSADTADSHAVRKLVAELLLPKASELQAMLESWTKRGEGASQITIDKFQSVMHCLIVISFNLTYLDHSSPLLYRELGSATAQLLKDVMSIAWATSESSSFVETTLKIIRPYIPALSAENLGSFYRNNPQVLSLISDLSELLKDRQSQQSSTDRRDNMDIDEEFESQESHLSVTVGGIDVSRRDTSLLDPEAFYYDTIQRLNLLRIILKDPDQIGLVPPAFLDELLALCDEELLSCRLLSKELFTGDLVIRQDDAMRVTERFGLVINATNFASCEAALHTCLNIVLGFITIWTDETTELYLVVSQLYEFFMEKLLPNNVLSPRTQIALSRILFDLTEINERFPGSFGLPTTIASLFKMLQSSTIAVQFSIGENLHRVFSRFVLKTHDQYCSDVVDTLPQSPDVPEGIALRLFVLSQLAKNWSTLLRRCVYHIFETPGHLLGSSNHAAFCLKDIAASLGLDGAQGLFDLFAPQLLYTWLNADSIDNIPFSIFGFATLEDLVAKSRSEAAAILMMRGQDADFAKLSNQLGLNPTELAESCFSKMLAYSMAYDMSLPKSEHHKNGESRIRKLMGRENFLNHVYAEFADVVAAFFCLIDQEDPIEKSWAKDDAFVYAAEIMDEIKGLGHSEVELSGNQQPSFRAKYLTRELSLLCGRTEYELKDLFTPSLVVATARKLLNTVHPALGPLHACSVIRKVRVLICLSGQYAYESYPLEMLLRSMQSFLTDVESADDALGMSQYLLMRGSATLSRTPSFVAGYALSTLASLRVFLESSQASTTQESQFKATMSKAQKFHKWLTVYLEAYQSPLFKGEYQLASFKSITQSAANVRSSGNAEQGTHESNLLLQILRGEKSDASLLDEPSRHIALRILAKDFKMPPSFRQDVINSDDEAIDLATAVWKTTLAQLEGDEYHNYRAWAGSVVGRSFAASGHVDQSLLHESKLMKRFEDSTDASSSEQGLLSLLQALTAGTDCFTAGLAESALRNIISEAASQEDNKLLEACGSVLPEHLLLASNWGKYRTPPSDESPIDPVSEALAFGPGALASSLWAKHLLIYLTQYIKGNLVLSALPQALFHVKNFAEDAFPYIIHLVLLSERETHQFAKKNLSTALRSWLKIDASNIKDRLKLIFNALLYLRAQKLPGEHSIADRSQWLDVDLSLAAAAATRCGMHKTALLLIESTTTDGSRQSRRSSTVRTQESTAVLLDIFENIDDPDAYYGLQDNADLSSILARLEYENDGAKSLAFRGAQFDSHLRSRSPAARADEHHLVGTLSTLGLSGLSHSLLQAQQNQDGIPAAVDSTFTNARRLEIWDLPVPTSTGSPAVVLYKAYQGCNQATSMTEVKKAIQDGYHQVMHHLTQHDASTSHIRCHLSTLAALTEMDDALNMSSLEDLECLLNTFSHRAQWMKSGRYVLRHWALH